VAACYNHVITWVVLGTITCLFSPAVVSFLKILRCDNNSWCSSADIVNRGSGYSTNCSGSPLGRSGPIGSSLSSSSVPKTLVQWHRSGFKLYWRALSRTWRPRGGRRRISKELRDLIFKWSPKIRPREHAGFMVNFSCSALLFPSKPSPVGCARHPEIPSLRNAGLHFSATIGKLSRRWTSSPCQQSLSVCSCFFIISHDRRRILHLNVTPRSTSLWVVQKLREIFPYESASRFLIFDRDIKRYGTEVPAAVRSMRIQCVRTSVESPWQNGIVERWGRELPPGVAESRNRFE
jgi:hypothetical protein